MTAVIEVGPVTVSGAHPVDDQSALAAVEFIDSDLALVDERAIPTDELSRDVLRSACGGPVQAVVLIVPTWWPRRRCHRMLGAAQWSAADAVTVTRAEVVRAAVSAADPAVAEISPDFVVVTGDDVAAVPRAEDSRRVGRAVADAVRGENAVVIDAPVGVPGAGQVASAIADSLRSNGVAVLRVDRRALRSAAANMGAPPSMTGTTVATPHRRGRHGVALLGGAVLAVAGLGLAFDDRADPAEPEHHDPETLLVEGRVGVQVPALWTVDRITDGPGSARVQVESPDDPVTALLVTQAPVLPGTTREAAAETLRAALAGETPGVFTDFVPDDHRGGRPVASYREIRPGRHIDWSVFVDGGVRIGIGCQEPSDAERPIGPVCDRAVRSAHAIF
ncbi:type VII secretion-associated protein [Mycobacterium sp. NPDC050551]|uniref:type VII secretion-associated protein n=1 Tax=Mycobacterium sp. NPDC050551 TaxID=3155407 RepID=UPI00343B1E9D